MPLCTYLNEYEFEWYSKIDDEGLNEYFQEVREISDRYYVYSYTIKHNSVFRKKTFETKYKVFYRLGYGSEVQCLLLPGESLTKEQLYAFFLGIINGYKLK
jgi:hypothetical protein